LGARFGGGCHEAEGDELCDGEGEGPVPGRHAGPRRGRRPRVPQGARDPPAPLPVSW
jgi:hypothetical protein